MKKVGTVLLLLATPLALGLMKVGLPGVALLFGLILAPGQANLGLVLAITILVFFLTGSSVFTL
ncbi:MAG: hypothetical protein HY650_07275 [Acidobacteria bacterium]|nr:hypothetical protein [Acidobacteriota bacterium]